MGVRRKDQNSTHEQVSLDQPLVTDLSALACTRLRTEPTPSGAPHACRTSLEILHTTLTTSLALVSKIEIEASS
jgi:hypothetical protein